VSAVTRLARVLPARQPLNGHRCGSCPLPGVCEGGPEAALPRALAESVVEKRTLQAGASLYLAGQKRCSVWVVAEGAFKTCELDPEGREQVVGFHGPGDVLGLDRVEVPHHRGFAVALETTRVCRIPVARLVARLGEHPELWRDVLRVAGQQLARAREVHRVLGQLQTSQRLAWFLLDAAGARSECGACACMAGCVVRLPMQRQDIASFLGMTLETVSRSMSALQKEGAIEVHGRLVTLKDPARLAGKLGSAARAAA
jgi:CRP/FNR family transcriptional regulator